MANVLQAVDTGASAQADDDHLAGDARSSARPGHPRAERGLGSLRPAADDRSLQTAENHKCHKIAPYLNEHYRFA